MSMPLSNNFTPKINNCDATEYVDQHEIFNGAKNRNGDYTIYARYNHTQLYIVYSYGHHFPMYIYDEVAQMWFGNKDRYSHTTSKHQSQAKPTQPIDSWLSTDEMQSLIKHGSLVDYLIHSARVVETYRQEVVGS